MNISSEKIWTEFAQSVGANEQQLKQFQEFYKLVVKSNELFNLTAITDLNAVIKYHFEDSLILAKAVDLSKVNTLVDVGSGAGFPGIPLKIMYPDLPIILIEVTKKKIQFLNDICDTLELDNIEVYPLDWRTFLRKTDYQADLFCARASLQPEELLRMFRQTSPYKNGQLVYWATQDWVPMPKEAEFISGEYPYKVGNKKRKLVFLKD